MDNVGHVLMSYSAGIGITLGCRCKEVHAQLQQSHTQT